ncbi:MAG: CCA tRNA nucleotidyltransferase, partial [Pseudomonadota bacterium]
MPSRSGDIDLATDARPADSVRVGEAAGYKVVPTGIDHGTVTLVSDRSSFEITTLRRDLETDGRHAVVSFTDDWAADAARRDFTINAIYADLDGAIFDPVGGLDDLVAGRLRFIGNADDRIREDYLRALRLFRFLAQFPDLTCDPLELASSTLALNGIAKLSAERVRVELLKLLSAPGAVPISSLLIAYGVYGVVLPTAPAIAALERVAKLCACFEGQTHTTHQQSTTKVNETFAIRALSALACRSCEDAERVADKLKLSNAERQQLRLTLRAEELLGRQSGPDDIGWQVAVLETSASAVATAIAKRSADMTDDASAIAAQRIADVLAWPVPQFPLTGRDLIKAGYTPGRAVGDA